MKLLLAITGIFEAVTGLAMVFVPALVTSFLVGVPLEDPVALVVARWVGVSLIALGGACWLARNDRGIPAGRALVAGMLFYNAAVIVLLVHAWTALGLSGPLLWPAVAVHVVLGVWCVAELVRSPSPRSP